MPSFFAGCVVDRPPTPNYVDSLGFAELSLHEPLPKPTTLARFRESVPESFQWALVLPKSTFVSAKGALRFDDELGRTLTWLEGALGSLRANAVVLRTPATVTTGQRDRELLADYVQHLRRHVSVPIVWAAQGLWTPEHVEPMARHLGNEWEREIPLHSSPAPMYLDAENAPEEATDRTTSNDNLFYVRLRQPGAQHRIPDSRIQSTVDWIAREHARRVFAVVESTHSFADATKLQQIFTELEQATT